jgi:23S rRNA (pseudouridine1915-N3)-methyltransferase
MKIKIIQIGKNKDKYLDEGVNEFLKRLKSFCKIEIQTLKEIAPSKTFTKEKCVELEGKEILANLENSDEDFIVALDERGREFTSIEFAKFLQQRNSLGISLCFIIGGAFGLSSEVKKRSNLMISFSKMTFTHQMIRMFLLEQIYRGFCISTGKVYHHS